MMFRVALLAAVVSLVVSIDIGASFRIGAWNIKQFGRGTMNRPGVKEIIKDVVSQYDLLVIQEVQDSSGESIAELQALLGNQYSLRMSEQGTRERYAALFKEPGVTVEKVEKATTYGLQYGSNAFTYPPLMLVLGVGDSRDDELESFRFGMIVLHTSPRRESRHSTRVPEELNNLADLSREFKHAENLPGVLIGGDLNAADPYVKSWQWPNIKLKDHNDAEPFMWLIGDDSNTSPYGGVTHLRPLDRMIVLGKELLVRTSGARPFCYDWEVMTPQEDHPSGQTICTPRPDTLDMVKRVSDHYPVEVNVLLRSRKRQGGTRLSQNGKQRVTVMIKRKDDTGLPQNVKRRPGLQTQNLSTNENSSYGKRVKCYVWYCDHDELKK